MRRLVLAVLLTAWIPACAKEAQPGPPAPLVRVAVASNFAPALESLTEDFESSHGVELLVSIGSTGKHTVQIRRGAPFDVFLAADAEHPRALEAEGVAIAGSRFTYALGRLMLWSLDPERVLGADSLQPQERDRGATLAIANPELAPYGRAARQYLESRGLWEDYPGLRVQGENVGQAYRFARSGNVAMAFVAQAQVLADADSGGHGWLVPGTSHDAIEQQAVLLNDTPEARAFLAFLRTPETRQRLLELGYEVPLTD